MKKGLGSRWQRKGEVCVVTSLPGRTGLGFMVAEKGLSVRCDQSPKRKGFLFYGSAERVKCAL